MPFQAVPQGIQVKLLMTQNGVRMENVWNVDYGAAVTPLGLFLVNTIFDNWVNTSYKTHIHSSVKFDQLIATDVSVANGAQDLIVPTATQGATGGAALPGNSAFVASLRTLSTGRNFRGRTYIPGLAETAIVDAQHATTGFAAAANVTFNDLISALVAGGYKLCVLSRFLANALRAVGLLTEVISVITDTKLDSQQRRTAN
jgi:hypothetical protein